MCLITVHRLKFKDDRLEEKLNRGVVDVRRHGSPHRSTHTLGAVRRIGRVSPKQVDPVAGTDGGSTCFLILLRTPGAIKVPQERAGQVFGMTTADEVDYTRSRKALLLPKPWVDPGLLSVMLVAKKSRERKGNSNFLENWTLWYLDARLIEQRLQAIVSNSCRMVCRSRERRYILASVHACRCVRCIDASRIIVFHGGLKRYR